MFIKHQLPQNFPVSSYSLLFYFKISLDICKNPHFLTQSIARGRNLVSKVFMIIVMWIPGTSIISNWRFKLRMVGTQHTIFLANFNEKVFILLEVRYFTSADQQQYCEVLKPDLSENPLAWFLEQALFLLWNLKSVLVSYKVDFVKIWNQLWWNMKSIVVVEKALYNWEWLKMVTPSSTLFFLHPLWNASDGLLNQMRLFCYNLRNSSQRCITMEISFLKPWQIHPKSC